jgi:PAS domain S-box-containing protein
MYELFFNYSNDILLITDNKGDVLDVNNSFFRVFGYPPKQVLSKNIKYFLHPDDVCSTSTAISGLSPEADVIHFEHRHISFDGKYVRLSNTAYLDVGTGNIFIVSIQMTEEKITAVDPKVEITKLVKNIAHEINNPLGIISGYTELIKAQYEKDTKINEKLDVILNATERITDIIQSLKAIYCSDNILEK